MGHPAAEAAAITGLDRASVYRALARYVRAHRVADLADAPRTGRPRGAPTLTDAQLTHTLGQDPLTLGYQTTAWTVALLATHLAHTYGATLSASTLRRRLHALDWRWKRPRYVYVEKDPHRAQKKGGSFAA